MARSTEAQRKALKTYIEKNDLVRLSIWMARKDKREIKRKALIEGKSLSQYILDKLMPAEEAQTTAAGMDCTDEGDFYNRMCAIVKEETMIERLHIVKSIISSKPEAFTVRELHDCTRVPEEEIREIASRHGKVLAE